MNNEYICYKNEAASILNYIDNHFEKLALSLGAEIIHIPALIESSALQKCGYFRSFPHHLTLASYYDPLSYDEIANSGDLKPSQVRNSNLYFTPAACLHFYPMLENEIIDKKILTTRARVYRYENNRFNGKTRIWDFTVREIVFVGTPEFVNNGLNKMKEFALDFMCKIGLNGKIKKASDHFYPSKFNNMKGKIQLSNSLKDELICTIDNVETAIASFNTHGNHFSKPFNFDCSDTIVSGCVGFGLERWIAAIEAQNITGDVYNICKKILMK